MVLEFKSILFLYMHIGSSSCILCVVIPKVMLMQSFARLSSNFR